MSNAFTLNELLLANELMFPADFQRLYAAACRMPEDSIEVVYETTRFTRNHKSNLLSYIGSIPRSDETGLSFASAMIKAVIKKKD